MKFRGCPRGDLGGLAADRHVEGREGSELHVELRNSSRGDAKQASPSPSLAAVKLLDPILFSKN